MSEVQIAPAKVSEAQIVPQPAGKAPDVQPLKPTMPPAVNAEPEPSVGEKPHLSEQTTQGETIHRSEAVEMVGHAVRRELLRRTIWTAKNALPAAAVYATILVAVGCQQQEFLQQLNIALPSNLINLINQFNIASPVINAFVTGLLGKELLRPFSRLNAAREQKKALAGITNQTDAKEDIAKVIARHKEVGEEKVAQWLQGNVDKEDRKNPQIALVQALRDAEMNKLEKEGVPSQEREEAARQRVLEAYKAMQQLAKEIKSSDAHRLKRVREQLFDTLLPAAAGGLGTGAALDQGGAVVGAAAGLIDDLAAAGFGAKKLVQSAVSGVKKGSNRG